LQPILIHDFTLGPAEIGVQHEVGMLMGGETHPVSTAELLGAEIIPISNGKLNRKPKLKPVAQAARLCRPATGRTEWQVVALAGDGSN
jgi:hypothetical protein